MKHVGNELFHIIESKKLVQRRIAESIGMDASQFGQLRKRESLDAKLLEKICKEIEISPAYFFDDWPSDKYTFGDIHSSTVVGDAQVNIGDNAKYLERILEEKERLIRVLMKAAGLEDSVDLK